jgi:very-short-patch-repair endonuclease
MSELSGFVRGKHNKSLQERARQLRREMTPAETILWKHLRTDQLVGLHFRRQQVLDGYVVDFYCHAAQLVIEVDGEIHASQQGYDAERDAYLNASGMRVLRLSNERILHDPPACLFEIQNAVSVQHE